MASAAEETSINVQTVATSKVEIFYWVTITFSQTLGTALGDWMADDTGLGFEGGALVFGVGLAGLAALYYSTRISRVFLFWAAFILTRPLGATVGDLLDKPHHLGGLALSRFYASAVLLAAIVALVFVLPQRHVRGVAADQPRSVWLTPSRTGQGALKSPDLPPALWTTRRLSTRMPRSTALHIS